jgi:trans-2,3-dihydro-3-hydroxyanthranilate isomerase
VTNVRSKEYVVADVFATAPYRGNQLAVFLDGTGLSSEEMQRAANEINYSETTFLRPPDSDDVDLGIRIFTPQTELPFAGHPLVGTGFVAAVRRLVASEPHVIRFATGVGTIEVRPEVETERSGRAWMRQPIPTVVAEHVDAAMRDEAAAALGCEAASIRIDRSPIAVMENGLPMAIVPLDALATVAALDPSPRELRRLAARLGAKTLLAFSTETVERGSTAHCRVWAPGAGVGEDPATGSANGPFGVYLRTHGYAPSDHIETEQGYEMKRPSRLSIRLGRNASGAVDEVVVGGGVHVTGEGRLFYEE